MHIKEQDILRFTEEPSHLDWNHCNLVVLDEVAFGNRGMLRKRGYAIRGEKVSFRGEFERKRRVSVLAFIGVNGIIDYTNAEGTFNPVAFLIGCRDFIDSRRAAVQQYPGRHSIWILDGATIHRHPEIVHYIRSRGIVAIFLPAYCPFSNPIEIVFGYVKRSFQRHYSEFKQRDLMPFIVSTFRRFENYNLRNVFEHCGWDQQISLIHPVPYHGS